MSINIESDGTSAGTKATTKDGAEIRGIKSISIKIDAGGIAKALLEFDMPYIRKIEAAKLGISVNDLIGLAEACGFDLVERK